MCKFAVRKGDFPLDLVQNYEGKALFPNVLSTFIRQYFNYLRTDLDKTKAHLYYIFPDLISRALLCIILFTYVHIFMHYCAY